MMLRPLIDRRFHQLINRNEPVGTNLFGDDVSKRLRDINDAHKLNRNLTSKNFRGSTNQRFNRRFFRGNLTPVTVRGTNLSSNTMTSARTNPLRFPRGCRQQAFQKRF